MKQIPSVVRASGASDNKGYTLEVDNNSSQRGTGVASNNRVCELNNNCVPVRGSDIFMSQHLSSQGGQGTVFNLITDKRQSHDSQGSVSANDNLTTDRLSRGSCDIYAPAATVTSGSRASISPTNGGTVLPSGPSCVVSSVSLMETDPFQSAPGQGDIKAEQAVSQSTHAITVLSPSIEKSLEDRNLAHQQSQPRRVRGIPGVSSSGDLSKLLTLEEDKELDITTAVRSEIEMHPPSTNRMSPGMMGRRHSMDSNIGRIRPPTFVRTYRDVKWKRVSNPSKLHHLPRTPSKEDLTAAHRGAEDEAESREYISGTHIIRQRVPIFMTSRDPPDPMSRRFSADDLIPVTGQVRNWTLNGKCLVIRDIVPSKHAHTSSSDDSSSSSSSPSSSAEDVRVSQSSDGSGDSSDGEEHLEFSLIDEDDEDDECLTSGSGDDEYDNRKDNQVRIVASDSLHRDATNDGNLASTQKVKTSKHFDLRRLALQNSLQHKATIRQPGTASNLLEPATASSLQVPPSNSAHLPSSVAEQPVMKESTYVPSLTTSTSQLSVNTQRDLMMTNAQPPIQSVLEPSTYDQVSGSMTTVSGILEGTSHVICSTSHTSVEEVPNQSHFVITSDINQTERNSFTDALATGGLQLNLTYASEPTDLPLGSPLKEIVSPVPSSPCEMPWVMTSTKIADANVYVSSSHPPNSNMSTRSAHWISPRSVEGTIPINLQDARAIRVETVAVPTSPESEPLQFQKVTYASGFIISSAQWVAPAETVAEPPSSNEVQSLLLVESADNQVDLPQSSSTTIQATSRPGQPAPKKKRRRKHVIERSATVLFNSESPSGVSLGLPTSRPQTQPLDVPSCRDDCLSESVSGPSIHALDLSKALHRQSKQRHDVDDIGLLDITETDLCAQLMSAPLSPTTTKGKFFAEKVPGDVRDASLTNLDGLSAKLDITFSSPTQPASGCVVQEVYDYPSGKVGEEEHFDLQQSQCSKLAGRDTSQLELTPSLTGTQDIPTESCLQATIDVQPVDSSGSSIAEVPVQQPEINATVEKRLSSGKHTKLRTDTEDDERFVKENDALLQMILTSISDTQEVDHTDNDCCGGSTVAIDNKIEQAMDLVKRHLMYAVREEVEILKQQIGEMMDRIGQLEYENTVLRSEAKPETLSKLLQPRLAQPPQTALTTTITAAPTQQQPAATQIQPQQQPQTTATQVGQPPSTT